MHPIVLCGQVALVAQCFGVSPWCEVGCLCSCWLLNILVARMPGVSGFTWYAGLCVFGWFFQMSPCSAARAVRASWRPFSYRSSSALFRASDMR